ncbi:Retrovirus-related Pol polyprotein from transposon TNT 1-94 [Dendrobium catenatum]|uniref:Retrovirus-related Pol polyprotein from transposon TNT 1-94 n=1 Tax=Dendrobium catenatum TaxID=906689 RepID=A0A2I0WS16_9ASPA|nr:Retrovirus-related Pol polyprotein from transposon TNT 1-94 [Dendrobium catenatum]PKU78446.1 Retrovirus-related Pol polyprotein from transposon TNT 1-94 [Dendrobium catenatum]PKU81025.1 Retrovirus-related Pol polyprotein from transposon TNT 1-94 [Dendrobium catenatum]PKU83961.1 Retrovirus-related Pol polyprotein from transposon TNT 1-94 [Dendrobium catenatum]
MYTRFTQIVTSLHALGREISNSEKVNKILRCLPSSYDAKITAITESKDLNVYSIDNLLGSLIAYEQGVSQRQSDAGEKKKERTVALKASNSESESSAGEEDDEIALMTRQFKNFLKRKQKRHQNSWNKGKSSRTNKVSSDTICFECRKPGHLRADCPNLKSQPTKEKGDDKGKYKRGKTKTQKAFWADSASESSEEEAEEEVTNLCLMANDNLDQLDQDEVCQLSYDELLLISENIHDSYRKLKKMHAKLNIEFSSLQIEHANLVKENSDLDKDHMLLLDEYDALNKKHIDLIEAHESLKTSHIELDVEYEKLTALILEVDHSEHLLLIEVDGLTAQNKTYSEKIKELEKEIASLTIGHPRKPPTQHASQNLRKRHHHTHRLVNPFPGVRCFSCGMLGHIARTCTIHRRTHLVWRPKLHPSQHNMHTSHSCKHKVEPKLTWVPKSNL